MRTAISHLNAGRPVDALRRLLELWPDHRDAALAEQIDRLGTWLDQGVKKVPAKRQHANWMERFARREPADVPSLLACLGDGTSKQQKIRVDCLRELPADPRITVPLLEWAGGGQGSGFMGVWGKVWTALFKAALHVGDPRMATGLKAIRDKWEKADEGLEWPVFAKIVGRIDKTLAKFPAPDAPVDVRDLAAAIDALPAKPTKEQVYPPTEDLSSDLLDQIYANPFDDGALEVLADVLTEKGDELGLFVSLQLRAEKAPLPKKDQATEHRLRKSLLNRLLGPLAPCVDAESAFFRRGLLTAAKVTFSTDKHRKTLAEHPAWRTVQQVHTSPAHLRTGALPNATRFGVRLIRSPVDTLSAPPGFAFQYVPPPPWGAFKELARSRQTFALEAVCVALPERPLNADEERAMAEPRALPNLNELHLVDTTPYWRSYRARGSRTQFDVLADQPLVRDVPTLVLDQVRVGSKKWRSVLQVWDGLRGKDGQRLVWHESTLCLTLWQDADGLHADVATDANNAHGHVINLLKTQLGDPGRFTSLTVRGRTWPGSALETLEKAVEKVGFVTLPKRKRGT